MVSVQALNQVVQRLIDSQFSVFQTSIDDEIRMVGYKEKLQLQWALKILKVLNFITENTVMLSDTGLNILLSRSESGSELNALTSKNMDLNLLLSGRGNLFHHFKLDASILKQIQDPVKLVSGGLSGLLKEIFSSCSFLFHFETKLLYFKLVSFLGVDINRAFGYLRNYQKKKAPGQQIYIPETDRQRGANANEKLQIETVARDDVLKNAQAISQRLEKRKKLSMKFEGEAGTGLGPTQEFFTLLGEAISSANDDKMWIIDPTDGTLFPSPIDNKALTPEKIKEVTEMF